MWSYRYKADDQLYADDEHGPTVFDPGASIGVPGSGNVNSAGVPILGQIAMWTDATHIAGVTTIPTSAHPALTGDVTVVAGTTVTAYNNPVPSAKAGVPTGGSPGQVLAKSSSADFATGWVAGGGNVNNVATPVIGQLAVWTDATHIQGVATLPQTNFPGLAGDIVVASGTLATTYNNPVPTAKAGLPVGGSSGQVLQKNTNTNFDTSWVTPSASGGNVSNSGAPQGGQVATWVDATHVQGLNILPSVNFPALTGDIVVTAGTTITAYGNAVPVAKGGVPPGGASGYVLAKSSNADYAIGWVAAPTGGGAGTPAGSPGQFQYNNAGAFGAVAAMTFDGTIPATVAKTGLSAFGTGILLQNTQVTTLDGDNANSPALVFRQHVHYSGADHVIESKLEARDQCLVFQNRTDGGVWEPGFSLSSSPAGGALFEYAGDIQIVAAVLRGLDDVTTGGDGGHPTRMGMFNYSTTARPGFSMTYDAFIGWAIPSSPTYQSWEAQNDTLIQRAAAGEVGIYSVGTTLGVMRVATASPGDNSTKAATTAFVTAAVAASVASSISEKGNTPLVSGQSYIDVTFLVAQPYTTWRFLELIVVNTTDTNPLNITPGIVTAKSTTGFRLYLNGAPDSGNYALYWATSPATVAVPATTYLFSGPSGGAVNTASTNFTVHLIADTTVTGTVTVTPNSGGAGGTFTPSTVALTTASPAATFTFTPTSGGAATISVTNNGGLTNPAGVVYTATATYTGSPVMDTGFDASTGTGASQGLGGGSTNTNCVGLGEMFTSTGGMLDHAVGLGWYNGGAPPGNVVCKLYAVSPAFFREGQGKPVDEDEVNPLPGRGLDISVMAVPGTLLATSNLVAASSVPAGGNVTFNFVGAQRYVMNAGTQYIIAFEYNSGVEGSGVILPWRYGTTYPGSMLENDSGVIPPTSAGWYVHGSDHDIPFEVWVVKPD